MNTKEVATVSGEIVPPAVEAAKPLVIIAAESVALASVPTVVTACELRLLELSTGYVHHWTGTAWRMIGREATWVAQRVAQLEAQFAELHASVGITDPHALMRDALVAKVRDLEAQLAVERAR